MNKLKNYLLNDHIILALIVLNAIVIFIQEFNVSVWIFELIEPLFTLIFLFEMVVKIERYGFTNFIRKGWNKFDFVLVLISLPSIFSIFFDSHFVQMNIFLALRVFRVFKFFMLIRFIPNVSGVLLSVQRALKQSYLVIAGFFVSIFIVSLISCSLFKTVAQEYFRNPLESFYTIFRLFSVEGWYEIPDLIASRSNPTVAFFSVLYFIILLLCGGIIGLSLVNSIFVDAMVSDNNDELKAEVSTLSKKIEALTEKIEKLNKNN